MTDDWFQLIYLLTAGAVVLLGARWQLRRWSWGETAWRALAVLLAVVAAVAIYLMATRGPANSPSLPAAGEAIAV